MRVRLIKNHSEFPHLSPEREYCVVGLDHESFRVLNDEDEPILYPKSVFDVTDAHIDQNWVWERFGDDEYYANPPELQAPGFYEDFFDGNEEARRQFESYVRRVGGL